MLTQACADAEERYTRLLGERPTPTGASGDQPEGEQMDEIPISTPDGTASDQQSPLEAGQMSILSHFSYFSSLCIQCGSLFFLFFLMLFNCLCSEIVSCQFLLMEQVQKK